MSKIRLYLARRSAQTAVVLLCLTIAAILWTEVAREIASDRTHAIDHRRLENDNLATVMAEHVTRTIRAADVMLAEIVSRYDLLGEGLDLVHYAQARQAFLDPTNVLAITDANGDRILTSISPNTPQNYADSEAHRHHMRDESDAPFLGAPTVGRASGKWTVYLSRRINKADGSFGGLARVGMDPQYFSTIYSGLDLGSDSVFYLVGRDGIVRARRTVDRLSAGENLFDDPTIQAHLGQGRQGSFIGTVADGIPRLYSYRAVENYPFVVLLGTSLADALRDFEEHRSNHILAGGASTLIVFGFGLLIVLMLTKAARVQDALRESEERYALAVDGVNEGIWDWNVLTGEDYLSPRWKKLLGYGEDELPNEEATFFERLHPDDRQRCRDALNAHFDRGAPYAVELRLRHKDGDYRWFLSRGEAQRDAAGRPVRMVGSIADIGARKEAERRLQRSLAEKETLLREIHHRVKNNLQIVSSLLYFQARKVKDPDDFAVLNDGRERLRAMMLVHENLYRSDDISRIDFEAYVRALTTQISESHAPRGRRIATRVEMGPRTLPIEIATPCGLLICELLINAFKYAFPDGRDGSVVVRATEADGRLAIVVADDGVGLPAGIESGEGGSFGWQMIVSLAAQIDGAISVARGPGTAVTISFPVSEIAS